MGYKRLNLKNGTKLNEEHFKHFEDSLEKQASYFGESLEWVTLAPEQNVKIEESFGSLEHNGYPKNDKTYNFRVTLDGESYIFENVSSHKDDYGSCWEIGEPFDYSSDEFDWSTYTFSVYIAESAKIFDIAVSPSISDGEHTVKVEMLDEVVQKLDGKYIEPDTLDLTAIGQLKSDVTTDVMFSDGSSEIQTYAALAPDPTIIDFAILEHMIKSGSGRIRIAYDSETCNSTFTVAVTKTYAPPNPSSAHSLEYGNQFIGFFYDCYSLYFICLSVQDNKQYGQITMGQIYTINNE